MQVKEGTQDEHLDNSGLSPLKGRAATSRKSSLTALPTQCPRGLTPGAHKRSVATSSVYTQEAAVLGMEHGARSRQLLQLGRLGG